MVGMKMLVVPGKKFHVRWIISAKVINGCQLLTTLAKRSRLTIFTGKNCFTQFKNGCLVASDLFHMFTEAIKLGTFYHDVLKSTDV